MAKANSEPSSGTVKGPVCSKVAEQSETTATAGVLISRQTLKRRWEVSIETLKRRERAGLLPFLKLGRGVRYRLADVEAIERAAEVRS